MGTMRAILILAVLMGWASTLPHLTFAALAGTTAVVVHRQPAT